MAQNHPWMHKSKTTHQLCRSHEYEPKEHVVLFGQKEETVSSLHHLLLPEGNSLQVKDLCRSTTAETTYVHSFWKAYLRYLGRKQTGGRSYQCWMHRRSDRDNWRCSGCQKHEEH